ncbi:MAG: 4'-phosphopantetheinyl transferase family protein [Anaerolineae bacterium]
MLPIRRNWRAPTGVLWYRCPDDVLARRPRLPEDGVHVWRTALDVPTSRLAELRAHLAPAEIGRAEGYRFPAPKQRFVAARGLLRELLGAYLDAAPARLRFRQNAWGKPLLADPRDALHFNVAHTGDLALIAVSTVGTVGIDVERVRPVAHLDRLVARYFSSQERAAFCALPRWQRLEAFFATWTRKEAYVKARGLGFHLPPDAFDVTVAADAPPRLLADRHAPGERHRWRFYDLAVEYNYKVSLVTPS